MSIQAEEHKTCGRKARSCIHRWRASRSPRRRVGRERGERVATADMRARHARKRSFCEGKSGSAPGVTSPTITAREFCLLVFAIDRRVRRRPQRAHDCALAKCIASAASQQTPHGIPAHIRPPGPRQTASEHTLLDLPAWIVIIVLEAMDAIPVVLHPRSRATILALEDRTMGRSSDHRPSPPLRPTTQVHRAQLLRVSRPHPLPSRERT